MCHKILLFFYFFPQHFVNVKILGLQAGHRQQADLWLRVFPFKKISLCDYYSRFREESEAEVSSLFFSFLSVF